MNVWMTDRMMNAIFDLGLKRPYEELLNNSASLYKLLSKNIIGAKRTGKDHITRVIDKNVGKTYCIIKASLKYGIPILMRDYQVGEIIQRDAAEWFGRSVITINVKSHTAYTASPIVLKDDDTTMADVRRWKTNCEMNPAVCGFVNIFE